MKLLEARKKLRFSQTQMAKECGVSLAAYILWEKEAAKPKPNHQKKIDELLQRAERERKQVF